MHNQIWNYISNNGIQETYDDVLKKRVFLTNKFSLVAILVFLSNGINDIIMGDSRSALIMTCIIAICILCFYLNRLYFHRLVLSILFTVISLVLFYFTSRSTTQAGTYLYYFPLIIAIVFVFDTVEDKKSIFFHFSFIFILLCIDRMTHHDLFGYNKPSAEVIARTFSVNLILSSLSVGLLVYIMIKNNFRQNTLYLQRIEERLQSEKIIKEALAEKNLLLSELHHRVKNNLAIISGLFSLKLNDDLNEDAKHVLLESRDRVRSMALIHNLLYNSDNFSDVHFDVYIQKLIKEINSSYPLISNSVKIDVIIDNVSLNVNTAIPCGLILNELLTNSYKHAFKGRSDGNINISISSDNGQFTMALCDNGVGLPDGYNTKKSLGMSVIEALSEQLDGTFHFNNNNGTCFELKFNLSPIM